MKKIKDSFTAGPKTDERRRMTASERAALRNIGDAQTWEAERVTAALMGEAMPEGTEAASIDRAAVVQAMGKTSGHYLFKLVARPEALDGDRLLVKIGYNTAYGTPDAIDVIAFVQDKFPGTSVEDGNDRKAGVVELVLRSAKLSEQPAGTAANPIDGQRDALSSEEIEGTGKIGSTATDPSSPHFVPDNESTTQMVERMRNQRSTAYDKAESAGGTPSHEIPGTLTPEQQAEATRQYNERYPDPATAKRGQAMPPPPPMPDMGATPQSPPPAGEPSPEPETDESGMSLSEALSALQDATKTITEKLESGDAMVDGKDLELADEAPAPGGAPVSPEPTGGAPIHATKTAQASNGGGPKDPEWLRKHKLEVQREKARQILEKRRLEQFKVPRTDKSTTKEPGGVKSPGQLNVSPEITQGVYTIDKPGEGDGPDNRNYLKDPVGDTKDTNNQMTQKELDKERSKVPASESPKLNVGFGSSRDQLFWKLDDLANKRVTTRHLFTKKVPKSDEDGPNGIVMETADKKALHDIRDRLKAIFDAMKNPKLTPEQRKLLDEQRKPLIETMKDIHALYTSHRDVDIKGPELRTKPFGDRLWAAPVKPNLDPDFKGINTIEANDRLVDILPIAIYKKIQQPSGREGGSSFQWQNLSPTEIQDAYDIMAKAESIIRNKTRNIIQQNKSPEGKHKDTEVSLPPGAENYKGQRPHGPSTGKGGIGLQYKPDFKKKSSDEHAEEYFSELYGDELGHQITEGCCDHHHGILDNRVTDIRAMAAELNVKLSDNQVTKLAGSVWLPEVIGSLMHHVAIGGGVPPVDRMVDMAIEMAQGDPQLARQLDRIILRSLIANPQLVESVNPEIQRNILMRALRSNKRIYNSLMNLHTKAMGMQEPGPIEDPDEAMQAAARLTVRAFKQPKVHGQPDDAVKMEKLKDSAEDGVDTHHHIMFSHSKPYQTGVYTYMEISWEPDDVTIHGNAINQAIRSFVKGLESRKEFLDFGVMGHITVDNMDADAGVAKVHFRCNKSDAVTKVTSK